MDIMASYEKLKDTQFTDDSDTTGKAKDKQPGARRAEHLADCRKALQDWRQQTWRNKFSSCAFRDTTLLPDKNLTTLASRASIKTVTDIHHEVPDWPFADMYGEDVLNILASVDARHRILKEQAKAERKQQQDDARRKATEEKDRVKRQKRLGQPLYPFPYQPPNIPDGYFWSWQCQLFLPIPPGAQHSPYFVLPKPLINNR